MHRRTRSCEGLRVRQFRTARPIRRLWRVFHNQLDDSPHTLSSPASRHCDSEVDTRCDATTGEPIAVDADAFVAGLSAKLAQRFPSTPVDRRTVASQQSSGPSSSEPVQTLHTQRARDPRSARNAIAAESPNRSNVGFAPPPTKRTSGSVQASSKLFVACTVRPQSVGTAPERCQTY